MYLLVSLTLAFAPTSVPLSVDHKLTVLPAGPPTSQLLFAAERLGTWEFDLAGVPINGDLLTDLASSGDLPLERHVRERMGRPIDLEDFLYLLDDILAAEARRGERFHIHSGRARSYGVLLHPDDVFKNSARTYPKRRTLPVDLPQPQASIKTPAPDGSPPGPDWTARFQNPSDRKQMLAALREERPDATFADRVEDLLNQLEAQGSEVYLASTTRHRERGYLMWGAFLLSRAANESELNERIHTLEDRNKAWGLNIDIPWRLEGDWTHTRTAARQMADTYDVVYATEKGAKSSNHYGGRAADLIGIALPRRLTLTAPDGATRSFDLTKPEESRDLSLTPRLIDWIEQHWGMRKLRSDYPHWTDTRD